MKGKHDKVYVKRYWYKGICNQYWPNEAAMLRHKKTHKKKSHREIEEEKSDEEQTEEGEKVGCQATINGVKNMPVFNNIFEIFKTVFVDA